MGAGKSIELRIKIAPKTNTSPKIDLTTSLIIKLGLIVFLFLGAVFLLSKVDFPAPKKEIEKIIPNENFKIVK